MRLVSDNLRPGTVGIDVVAEKEKELRGALYRYFEHRMGASFIEAGAEHDVLRCGEVVGVGMHGNAEAGKEKNRAQEKPSADS
jgi:hypothetical protein